jgi:hypothetical protein
MRSTTKKVVLYFILCLSISFSYSQLNPGDIAFVQYNSDSPDNFSFVCLVDIPPNEVIKFTDNGWKSDNTWRANEQITSWTAPVGGVSCGTVVSIEGTTASVGTSSNSLSGLSSSGDQIIAYQGVDTMIAAINFEGSAVWQADATSSNTSSLPNGLTNGTDAVAVQEIDNAKYNGSVLNDTKANLLTAINNSANWSGSNSVRQTFSNTFTITDCVMVPCTEPTSDAAFHVNSPQNIATTSVTLNWTNGDGANRIVVMREASAVSATPTDGTTYNANSVFGTGATIAANEYVVYNGNSNTVDVTGLTPGTTYYTTIFEYNCNPGSEDYYTSGTPTTDIFVTEPENPDTFTSDCILNTSIDLNWTAPVNGNFDNYLLVVREGAAPHSVNSIDPSSIVGDNLDYSVASTYGGSAPNSRYLYNGSVTSATITGLTQGLSYTFELYAYTDAGTIFEYSTGTTITRTISFNNVTNAAASGGNMQATTTWTNPNGACFDEILVVVNETSSIGFSPSGDGTAYTPNTVYAGVDQVVFLGTGNSVTITGLTNGTTYYIEIFVRQGTTWSSGVEVSVVPNVQTTFEPGDLMIVAYDNKILNSPNDKVTILTMVDIIAGTTFWYANATYEIGSASNVRNGQWHSCNSSSNASIGAQKFTYNGPDILPAGSTFCINIGTSTVLGSDFSVQQVSGSGTYAFSDGVPLISSPVAARNINISTSNPDAIFLMQGDWSGDLGGYRTFSGTVLGGIQDGANWHLLSDDLSGVLSTTDKRTSRIPPDLQCFAIQGTTTPSSGFAYYNGTRTGSQIALISDIIDFNVEWTSGAGTNNDDVSSNSCIASYVFIISGTATAGVWTNSKSDNDWFNCGNWENFKVPDETIDVVINNNVSANDNAIINDTAPDADIYGGIAKCKNLTISGEQVVLIGDINDKLEVHGNLDIGVNGELNMDDGASGTPDGQLYLYGNWVNQNTEIAFKQGESTVHFVGSSPQTAISNAGADTEKFYNLILDNDFTTDDFNSDIIAEGSLTLKTGKALTIQSNHYAQVNLNLTIESSATLDIVHQGSLIQVDDSGTVTNSGTTIVRKTTTPYVMYDYTYWSSPVENQVLGTVFSANNQNYIFQFNTAAFQDLYNGSGIQTSGTPDTFDDNSDDWVLASGAMSTGKGYIVMGEGAIFPYQNPTATTTTQSISFNGKVNNGVITTPVTLDLYNTTNGSSNAFNKNDNLLGNPYPSAIDAEKFLIANPNLGGTIYLWSHYRTIGAGANIGPDAYNFTNDDYATWVVGGGTAAHPSGVIPTGVIASGQGFFVTTTVAGNATFNNAMRVKTGNTNFFRTSIDKNRIWLNMTNDNGLFRQILIGFYNDATDNFDRKYDGKRLENGTNYDFYSILNNERYAIQGFPYFNTEKSIPIGVEIIQNGTYKISIDHLEGDITDTNVYLKDYLLNVVHDLKVSDYNFIINATGINNNRFEIVFSKSVLDIDDIGSDSNSLIISNLNNIIHFEVQNQTKITSIKAYDILGKLIYNVNPNAIEYSLDSKFKKGTILIFKVALENGTITSRKFIKF